MAYPIQNPKQVPKDHNEVQDISGTSQAWGGDMGGCSTEGEDNTGGGFACLSRRSRQPPLSSLGHTASRRRPSKHS